MTNLAIPQDVRVPPKRACEVQAARSFSLSCAQIAVVLLCTCTLLDKLCAEGWQGLVKHPFPVQLQLLPQMPPLFSCYHSPQQIDLLLHFPANKDTISHKHHSPTISFFQKRRIWRRRNFYIPYWFLILSIPCWDWCW